MTKIYVRVCPDQMGTVTGVAEEWMFHTPGYRTRRQFPESCGEFFLNRTNVPSIHKADFAALLRQGEGTLVYKDDKLMAVEL